VVGAQTKALALEVEVIIEKPDPCYEVRKVEGNRVYLERRANCIAPQVIVPEKIKLNAWYDVLKIYVDGRFWKEIEIGRFWEKTVEKRLTPEDVMRAIEDAKKKFQNLGNFSNVYEKEAREIAEMVYNMTQGEKFQREVERYKESLVGIIMQKEGLSLKDVYKDYIEKKKRERKKVLRLDPDERLYVFVSSSVPKETVRNYVAFVSSHIEGDVVFVLRGGVGGLKRLGPTVAWIYDVIKKDKFCEGEDCEVYGVEFVIDPFLFRRYGVEKVPAVVYAKGEELTKFEMSEGFEDKWRTKVWAKTYGDMGLAYHLKVIGEELNIEKIKRFIGELNM
jgi:hypothetical protein